MIKNNHYVIIIKNNDSGEVRPQIHESGAQGGYVDAKSKLLLKYNKNQNASSSDRRRG